jgi:hypothetical protein
MTKKGRGKFFATGVLAAALGSGGAQAAGIGGADAEWWQWALSIPLPVNPVFDDTCASRAKSREC